MAGVFRLADMKTDPVYVMRFKGLEIGRRYRVTSDNQASTTVMEGRELMFNGVNIVLSGALTSELLICETCD